MALRLIHLCLKSVSIGSKYPIGVSSFALRFGRAFYVTD